MNTLETTNLVVEAEETEPASSHSTAAAPAQTRVRYGMLAVIVVLSAWLYFTLHNSINEIESTLDRVYAELTSSPR